MVLTFTKAMLQLGLGRDSLFFKYDDEKRSFSHVVEHVRLSGYSLQALQRYAFQPL